MPKYYPFKICGYYLYYTSHCTLECMHVHASNESLSERGAAKFFVRGDGSTEVSDKGRLSDREIREIRVFIKNNHEDMYAVWRIMSDKGYYGENAL